MLIPHQKLTVKSKDILSGFFSHNENSLKQYLPDKKYYWVGSAREGIRQILLKEKVKTVTLPSFTCSVVLQSILFSKTKPYFIDSGIIPEINEIKGEALILPYNFGFLPDIEKIKKQCKKKNVLLIEDCSQALGARYNNKLAGSFGDYSVFSFGISKNIGFIGGLVNENFPLWPYPLSNIIKNSLKGLIAQKFFNPYVYPLVKSFLDKELIKRHELLNYKMGSFSRNVVLNISKRYGKILKSRKSNANLLMEELEGIVDFVKPLKNTEPSWLYFIIMDKNRDKLRKDLLKEKVDIQPLLTFEDLSRMNKKATQAEKQHLAFALYRSRKEIKYIIKKIKKIKQ